MQLTVRVNPKDHSQMAVDTHDGTRSSWVSIPDGFWKNGDDVSGWPEFFVDVPKPERQFQPGDVVDVKHVGTVKRAVRLGQVWYATDDDYIGRDSRVTQSSYTYVGNVSSL